MRYRSSQVWTSIAGSGTRSPSQTTDGLITSKRGDFKRKSRLAGSKKELGKHFAQRINQRLTMQRIHGRYSLGWRSEVQSPICMYLPDSEKWLGCPKDQPQNQAPGDSFDGVQLKLHKLCGDSSQRTPSSSCYNKALFCWYWQRRLSRSPYSHIEEEYHGSH